MAGEDFFKFNKGNEFRFSNFREIKEEDLKGADEKTKKLFNIFAGEDKILQEVEAKSLFNVLKTAAGDNQVLEDNEIKAFAKEHIGEEVDTNALMTFVNNIFGTKEKPQTQAMQVAKGYAAQKQQTFLVEAACKEIVIDIIDENLSEAYEILNSQYLGSISGWHDEKKDKNDILKTSNVSKVLDYQNAGIEWMNKAKIAPPNGLTKKEYYEGNKQRIKDMILTRVLVLDTNTKFKELKNKYSEEKLAQIIGDYVEQLCSNASMEDLKDIQKQFVSYSGVEEIQALENVVDNAIKFNADKNKPMPYSEVPLPKFDNSKGIVPEYWNSDEPISFEEVYKIERGTEYSQYKIEQYALAKKEMEVVANAYNKKQQFIEFAEGLRKDETLNIDEKTQKVLEGFATYYALAEDGGLTQLKELIAKSKLPISIDENGFNFGTLDDNAKNRALNSLLKLAQQSKEKEFEEFLNGKTIEDYQIVLAQAHDEAIGDENGKMMAEAMKNDNLTCIQRWTGNTSMAGMGMTIVGGILCFTPLAPLGAGMITVGNTLAIGGMVAKTGLGVTDYATKDVQTAEEAEQLTKDFIMDAGGFIIGMGAGKAGLKAFSKLIDKKLVAVFGQQIAAGNKMQALKTVFTNPEYLKNFMTAAGAKLSADFVISYAGDLAMMGILDTQDDWQSLLKANLTGILVGMSGDIKDVSGVGRPRNFGVSDGVRPMTEMDYGQRLLGNDVTVADPKTGATVEGTVTGLYSQNGQVEIEVNGQRYSTNDVAEVKGEVKVEVETPKVEISLGQRLETASSREEFVAIRDEIKAMPAGAEKTALQQEYLRKWNEFSRKYNEQFDIRMEYKPESSENLSTIKADIKATSLETAKAKILELCPDSNAYYLENILNACKINNEVSQVLLEEALFLLKNNKDIASSSYVIESFKTKDGKIDTAIIGKFHELVDSNTNMDDVRMTLSYCKDKNGLFSENLYNKLTSLREQDYYAHEVLNACKINGEVVETTWQKALELESLGFKNEEICKILEACQVKESQERRAKVVDFSDELYSKAKLLFEEHKFEPKNIYLIIEKCTVDGKFSQEHFDRALNLHNKIEEYHIHDFMRYPDDALVSILDLKNKYDIKELDLSYIIRQCVETVDGKSISSQTCFEKANEMISSFGIKPKEVASLLSASKIDGVLDSRLYKEVINLHETGFSNINRLIDSITTKPSKEGDSSIVNYDLLQKAKEWHKKGISEDWVSNYAYSLNSQNLDAKAYDLVIEYYQSGFKDGQITNLIYANSNLDDISLSEFKDAVFELKKLGLDNDKIITALHSIGLPNGWGNPNFKITKRNLFILKDLVQSGVENPNWIFNMSKDNYVINQDRLEVLYQRIKDGVPATRLGEISYIEFNHPENKELIDTLLELSKLVREDYDRNSFIQLTQVITNAHLNGNKDLITSTFEALKVGIKEDDVMRLLESDIYDYNVLQNVVGNDAPKVIAEIKTKILDSLKNNPEKAQQIFDIYDRVGKCIIDRNLSLLDLCLKHPDKYNEILNSRYPLDYQNNRSGYPSTLANDLIIKLDDAGIPIDDVLKYTDIICKNTFRQNETYPTEVINKIVELHNSNKLDSTILELIKYIPKVDHTIELLNEIIRLKDDNLLAELNDGNASYFIYNLCVNPQKNNPSGVAEIHENYKEILEFYIKNKDILTSKELKSDGQVKADILDFFRVYKDNYVLTENKLNLDDFQAIVDIVSKTGLEPYTLLGVIGNGHATKLKAFTDKVDLEKYSEEIKLIFNKLSTYHNNYAHSKFLESDISAKELEFLLDIQKLMIKRSKEDPQVLDNFTFRMFNSSEEMSDEALNKLRYYLEMDFADPNITSKNINISCYEHLMEIYRNCPENITRVESLMFDKGFHDGWDLSFIRKLSTNPEILNKQLELLDNLFDYTGELSGKKEYLQHTFTLILDSAKSVEDINVKIETWEKLKKSLEHKSLLDKTVDLFKRNNALLEALDMVHSINKDNQNVANLLMSDKKYKRVLDNLWYITKENAEAVEHIIKNNKTNNYNELIQFMTITQHKKFNADFVKENLDIIPENQLSSIANRVNDLNKDLIIKLYGDKELNFPAEYIVGIAETLKYSNVELITKLCTDKSINFPPQHISNLAVQLNDSNLELATKLCMDKSLNCPKDRIPDILKAVAMINTDIKSLSLSDKINTFGAITSLSKDILNLCRKYSEVDIDAKMAELTLALGKKKDIITISQEQQKLFVKDILANNNSNAENILKNFNFAQFGKEGLPLKYTREQFTANIKNLIKDLTPEEQIIVLEHFGLIEGAAGFDGMPTNKPFNNEDATAQLKETAQKIQSEIELFTTKNQICTGDATVDSVLNSLIQGLPEFTSIVGKKQHGTHAYSVDIHTLKVLQSAMNNPLYKNLTDRDKTILKFAALCHDLGKRGDVVDVGHASSSAEFCTAILDKFSFPQGMKDRIIDIVDNHHWFEAYNTGKATANDVAVRCRRPEDFLIYEILAKADFENVNNDFHLGGKSNGAKTQAEFDRFMQERMQAIDDALTTMYARSNLVFDTQFVQNGDMFPRQAVEIDGELIELKVLDLNNLKSNESLQKYGFSTGVTKDNARFTVHMTSPSTGAMESVLVLTQNSLNQSAWSTSLIKASNNRTYENRKFGFVLDVDQANISEANFSNTGSGYGKGLETFKTILFDANGSARTFVRDRLIKELSKKGIKLNDKEYAQLVKYLITKKYTTQITKDIKIGEQVIKAEVLVKALETSRDALFEGGDIHSEIVPINPRVKGLIAKVEKLEDCPPEFLNFAKTHNLPIILMKPTKENSEW